MLLRTIKLSLVSTVFVEDTLKMIFTQGAQTLVTTNNRPPSAAVNKTLPQNTAALLGGRNRGMAVTNAKYLSLQYCLWRRHQLVTSVNPL